MSKNDSKSEQPRTLQSVMWRILFMIACGTVWAITYKVNPLLPEFWQVGFPPYIGWVSYIVYDKLFG